MNLAHVVQVQNTKIAMANSARVEVAAGIVADNGKMLMALRQDHQHQAGCWEFPGGKLEPGESPQACMIRELFEEVGIQALACHPIKTIDYDYPDKQVRLHFFRVDDFIGQAIGKEGQTLRWITLDELKDTQVPKANQALVDFLLDEKLGE